MPVVTPHPRGPCCSQIIPTFILGSLIVPSIVAISEDLEGRPLMDSKPVAASVATFTKTIHLQIHTILRYKAHTPYRGPGVTNLGQCHYVFHGYQAINSYLSVNNMYHEITFAKTNFFSLARSLAALLK